MSVLHLPSPANCPACGRRPVIGVCEPWPRNAGPQPWYAVCYFESWDDDKPGHCIGVNGFSQREVMNLWNAEVNEYQQERVCQKCGALTNSEEALVDGQIWCHPCADNVTQQVGND